MKEFTLDKAYSLQIREQVIVPAETIVFSTFKREVTDTGTEINAKVFIEGADPFEMALWNKDTIPTYDAIGAWNDDQVNNRILEIFKLR